MEDVLLKAIEEVTHMIVTPLVSKYKLEILREGEQYRINLQGESAEQILGGSGETLNAVQHLVRVLVHHRLPKDRTHFIFDINLTRSKREKFINEEIPLMAKNEVLALGMTIILKNLSSYERRIIHNMLEEVAGLETMSVGEGVSRKLLIRPTSDTGSLGMDNSKIVDIANLD